MSWMMPLLLTILAGVVIGGVRWQRRMVARHAEIEEALQRGALLVDVRQPHEFEARHLPGAINVPLHRLASFADRCTGAELVVYSGYGQRSFRAAKLLGRLNRVRVHDVGAMQNLSERVLALAVPPRSASAPTFRPVLAPRARWAVSADA